MVVPCHPIGSAPAVMMFCMVALDGASGADQQGTQGNRARLPRKRRKAGAIANATLGRRTAARQETATRQETASRSAGEAPLVMPRRWGGPPPSRRQALARPPTGGARPCSGPNLLACPTWLIARGKVVNAGPLRQDGWPRAQPGSRCRWGGTPPWSDPQGAIGTTPDGGARRHPGPAASGQRFRGMRSLDAWPESGTDTVQGRSPSRAENKLVKERIDGHHHRSGTGRTAGPAADDQAHLDAGHPDLDGRLVRAVPTCS